MKALIVSSLALAVLASGAWAQTPPPPPPAGMKPPPPPPDSPDASNEEPGGPPPPPGGRRPPPPPPPSKAAHFRIRHGDTLVDVKCADDEPMKACADITLQFLDKVKP